MAKGSFVWQFCKINQNPFTKENQLVVFLLPDELLFKNTDKNEVVPTFIPKEHLLVLLSKFT